MVFGEESRRRAFWRIARTGQSPDRVHPKRGFSLVERLGRVTGFERTAEAYRSSLWRLVGRHLLSRVELEALKTELMAAFKLYQADGSALGFAENGVIQYSFLREVLPQEFAAGLRKLAPSTSLDWLALLCTLYRLAIEELDLDFAIELRNLIREYYIRLFKALEIGRFGLLGEKELQFLIEMRVLRGDTSAGPPAWAFEQVHALTERADALAKKAVKGRRKSDGTLMRKLPSQMKHKITEAAIGVALFSWRRVWTPVVPQSQETDFIEHHRADLVAESIARTEARILEDMKQAMSQGEAPF